MHAKIAASGLPSTAVVRGTGGADPYGGFLSGRISIRRPIPRIRPAEALYHLGEGSKSWVARTGALLHNALRHDCWGAVLVGRPQLLSDLDPAFE